MFPLLSLLGHLNHHFNVNVLGFQAVKFQMDFIDQVNYTVVAIFQVLKTVQAVIFHHLSSRREAVDLYVRD